jgi:ArsR family transcriptional regulator
MILNNNKKPELNGCSADEYKLWEVQADICQTLANPKRLQILNLLKEGELSVGAMVRALGIAKPNLSQHLAVMRQKGILVPRREGTVIYYRLTTPYITDACKVMRQLMLEVLSIRNKFSRDILAEENIASTSGIEKGPKDSFK